MKLTPEQLAEWKALVPKLNDDSNDHMGVAHSADMPPEHTVNYRHARNAEEAAFAITALIAELERQLVESRDFAISEAVKIRTEYERQQAVLVEALGKTASHIEAMMAHIEHKPQRFKEYCWSQAVAARAALAAVKGGKP